MKIADQMDGVTQVYSASRVRTNIEKLWIVMRLETSFPEKANEATKMAQEKGIVKL